MAKKKGPITSLSPLHDAAKKPRGAKQTEIPGTERKKIAAVEEAFEEWDEVKAKRLLLKDTENARYESVIEAMRKANVTTYKFASQDGTTITLSIGDKTKIKVHKAKPEAFKDTDEA